MESQSGPPDLDILAKDLISNAPATGPGSVAAVWASQKQSTGGVPEGLSGWICRLSVLVAARVDALPTLRQGSCKALWKWCRRETAPVPSVLNKDANWAGCPTGGPDLIGFGPGQAALCRELYNFGPAR
ncbi:hypothetical protein PCASD_14160 [Puccinia coronata f. sp. avenae]|uniref:Uncharacterized protein n=1 Tax=Puccinia coronata f. sp. avenae TaxID=200324 RepID=A0A2N5TEK7_9BASI|nr:hypothetical protein PCASD_14160 [Puccinia coronata f. sp. avenae]